MGVGCENGFQSPLAAKSSPAKGGEALRALVEDIVYQMPSCPDISIRKELQRAWRDFADRTSCWKATPKVALAAGDDLYAIPTPYGATVKTVDFTAFIAPEGGFRPFRPREVRPDGGGNWLVRLQVVPDGAFVAKWPDMEIRITLLPWRNDEDAPQWVVEKYGPALAAGAIWRLASQEGKPWSNAALAEQSLSDWRDALNEASIRAIAPDGVIRTTNWEGWA